MMPEESLELDPGSVKTRQDSYSSLTDLYHINAFTQEFRFIKDDIQKQGMEANEKLKQDIFIYQVLSGESEYAQVTEQLFLGKEETVLIQSYATQKAEVPWFQVSMLVLSVLFILGIYRLFGIHKKSKGGKK